MIANRDFGEQNGNYSKVSFERAGSLTQRMQVLQEQIPAGHAETVWNSRAGRQSVS
jgi:hypothetical protein